MIFHEFYQESFQTFFSLYSNGLCYHQCQYIRHFPNKQNEINQLINVLTFQISSPKAKCGRIYRRVIKDDHIPLSMTLLPHYLKWYARNFFYAYKNVEHYQWTVPKACILRSVAFSLDHRPFSRRHQLPTSSFRLWVK